MHVLVKDAPRIYQAVVQNILMHAPGEDAPASYS
jgi:hypothetical protein